MPCSIGTKLSLHKRFGYSLNDARLVPLNVSWQQLHHLDTICQPAADGSDWKTRHIKSSTFGLHQQCEEGEEVREHRSSPASKTKWHFHSKWKTFRKSLYGRLVSIKATCKTNQSNTHQKWKLNNASAKDSVMCILKSMNRCLPHLLPNKHWAFLF